MADKSGDVAKEREAKWLPHESGKLHVVCLLLDARTFTINRIIASQRYH